MKKNAIVGQSGGPTTVINSSLAGVFKTAVEKVANAEKLVPQAWISSDGTNVTKEFEDYARPLIVGELSPFMVDGVPRHLFI